jgi:hypothetical protein
VRRVALVLLFLTLGTGARAGGEGPIKLQGKLLERCKVPLAKAVEKALEACPGQAVAARLTTDDEGAPVFRVTIHRGDKATNVWVDALEGKAKVRETWTDEGETPKGE